MVPELNAHQSKYRFFFCVSWWKQISPQDSTMQISNVYVFFYFSSLVWFIGLFFFFYYNMCNKWTQIAIDFFFLTRCIPLWRETQLKIICHFCTLYKRTNRTESLSINHWTWAQAQPQSIHVWMTLNWLGFFSLFLCLSSLE